MHDQRDANGYEIRSYRACHEFFDGRFVPRVLDNPEAIKTKHQNDAEPRGKFGQ